MRLDFSSLPLKNRAFSQRPMAFMDPEAKNFLSAILDLAAIETGNGAAREHWQQRQLENLLSHAAARSPFWRQRLNATKIAGIRLADLPVQSRADVIEQVTKDGPLARMNEAGATKKHPTSGSSGIPVQFFVTERNSIFNLVRSICQYFLEDADLSLNVTRVSAEVLDASLGFTVARQDSWILPLQSLVRTGAFKRIEYLRPDMKA